MGVLSPALCRRWIGSLAKIDEAVDAIRSLRLRTGRIEVDELLSARDEGRKS